MERQWRENRFIDSAVKTIIVFVCLHLGIVSLLAFKSGDVSYLSLVRIIHIDAIFPELAQEGSSFFIGILFAVLVYSVFFFQKKNRP